MADYPTESTPMDVEDHPARNFQKMHTYKHEMRHYDGSLQSDRDASDEIDSILKRQKESDDNMRY